MALKKIIDSMEYGPAPESTAEAHAWLDGHGRRFGHFINGGWKAAKGAKTFKTRNPATGDVLATITQGGKADVNAAIKAARVAQTGWAKLAGHGRAKHLYALARQVQKQSRLLAVLETLDNGKPIRESRDIDVPLVARHFYHHAGWAQLMASEFPDQVALGVIGQIVPWNFPLLMLSWKIAPALAAGNTVVLKPAEYTSLTALLFAELCDQAGLPPGVVNIVTGDGRTGEMIVNHKDINKIAFTGSTAVGSRIREQTAGSGKKLSLELGGKSPFIVFPDADMDSAVEGVVDAIWFNQGQVCCAGSRLLVQEGIATTFMARLKARMANLRVGDPLDKCIDMGAIIDPVQLKQIENLVKIGVKEGAKLWQADCPLPKTGCFYPPTLLENVTPTSTVAQQEIFGPVLTVTTFRTPDEAVELANNTRYGLAASIWSENINLALDMAPAIKAGIVWINTTNQMDASAGFGGYRDSGFGREGGREGMYEYMKPAFERGLRPQAKIATRKPKGKKVARAILDRTSKNYVGGKQARPDSGYSRIIYGADGAHLAEVGEGNRKDIRNAVEAAAKASSWASADCHNRAQILYYIAENLSAREGEFADRLRAMTGVSAAKAGREVQAAIARLFTYGAWADKFDGAVHSPPLRGVTLAMNEPVGIIGLICPQTNPLLGLVSLIGPTIAMGNRVVVIPSEAHPLSATDFYQILDTSDLPDGVVNIITGNRDELAICLASHDQVDGIWYFGSGSGSADVERLAARTIKRTWVNYGLERDFLDSEQGEGREFLRHATEVKNIWIPYGE
ncbi:MAG TPA: aldehyde dehydrogenase family protein [Rhodospirillales bacterium]|nr:aldehyde dehydrogenase family protein [Rhodospirillales bacterium]